MRTRLLLAAAICSASISAQADVRDDATERALSLPGVAPAIVLPKEGWTLQQERRKDGDTAVYYLLQNEKTKLNFSVYIDKEASCNDAAACLKAALKNPGYKDAQELADVEVAGFKGVKFFVDNPNNYPIKQAHILAAAYVNGHRFDIHISKAEKDRPDQAPLVEFLKAIAVR